ncbi:MAG: nitroreductase family protein [Bacteroidales bacterium]|nr:nitroreductase family protein [Bacteroidales bacterium]
MKAKHFLAAVFSAALLFPACQAPQTAQTPSFDEIVASRRSIRKYDPARTVSEADVRTLIATALEAPSWANVEATRYYVILESGKLAQAKQMLGGNLRNVEDAPALIVTTWVKGQSGFFRGEATNEVGEGWGTYDAGLSNAYLILKAREMGMDTLIMGMRDAEALRTLLDIPQEEEVLAVLSLGYRVEDPSRPNRKSVDEVARFF